MPQHPGETGQSPCPQARALRQQIAQLTAENARLRRSQRFLIRLLCDAWSNPHQQEPGQRP